MHAISTVFHAVVAHNVMYAYKDNTLNLMVVAVPHALKVITVVNRHSLAKHAMLDVKIVQVGLLHNALLVKALYY
jgi:branched-subunit amino acid transport protein AzlD